ncbi:hypothetical protein ONE63_011551 [Megalurothrips usitatus]|uniref:SET domain-containing protein n=1 Tax=Megalurothrips usitatus TaxID=439358 RepID=A0AAV7WZ18_9NEOP|nr:hypothetical protein ONE63_011551 [Megalurothrips usitatus]
MGARKASYYRQSRRTKSRLASAAKTRLRIHVDLERTRSTAADAASAARFAGDESGLEVREYGAKGRGVAATRAFPRGIPLLEYAGELVSHEEGLRRELAMGPEDGCFLFFFRHGGRQYCIDATPESGRLGRLVNHSRWRANARPLAVVLADGVPRIFLLADRDIARGEEIVFDYGDARPAAVEDNPWLND